MLILMVKERHHLIAYLTDEQLKTSTYNMTTISTNNTGMVEQGIPFQQGFGPGPQTVHCSHCMKDIITVVDCQSTDNNTCFGIIFCLIGCLPCALYMWMCSKRSTDLIHSCSTCGCQFGTYKEFGSTC